MCRAEAVSVESGSIKVCGVIGDPIAHSLSPALHQYAYARLGIADQYCYSAFRVESHELAAAIAGVHALGLRGLSCTMPHKSSVLQHLDELDPAAEAIGAVNTIVNERGVLKGYNSDWIGIRDPLTARFDLEGRSVAILGAGGAARAACYALQQIGALPVVYNLSLIHISEPTRR